MDGIVLYDLGLGLFELEYLTPRQIFSAFFRCLEDRERIYKNIFEAHQYHALRMWEMNSTQPNDFKKNIRLPWQGKTDRIMTPQEQIEFQKKHKLDRFFLKAK